MKKWVVVASKSEAKFFKNDDSDNKVFELNWIHTLVNKNEFQKMNELINEKFAFNICSIEKKDLRAEIDSIRFAQKIVFLIKTARLAKQFKKVTIFAGPEFLGKIRQEARDQIKYDDLIFVPKNIEKANKSQILSYLLEN